TGTGTEGGNRGEHEQPGLDTGPLQLSARGGRDGGGDVRRPPRGGVRRRGRGVRWVGGQLSPDLEEDVEGRLPDGDVGPVAGRRLERDLVLEVDRDLLAGAELDLEDGRAHLLVELGDGGLPARPADAQVVVEAALVPRTAVALAGVAVVGLVVDVLRVGVGELDVDDAGPQDARGGAVVA